MPSAVLKVAGALGINPQKIIKVLFMTIMIPTIFIVVLFIMPLTVFKTVPYLNEAQLEVYKQAATNVGKSGAQVDWKYLVAIDAVRFENNFDKSNLREAEELGRMFIEEHTETDSEGNSHTVYTLKSLNEVLNELNFNEEQKTDVYNYLEMLTTEYGGSIGDLDDVETGVMYSIPHFYQTDSRWSSIGYGSSTIGSAGCGPTSFAMVATGMNPKNLSLLDTNGDKIIDPSEAARYSESHGYKGSDGTGWGFFQDAGSKIGLTVTQYSVSQYSQVLSDLKSGYPVISSQGPGLFTRSGHFIVLVGFASDGKIIVNDPSSEARSNKTWTKEEIVASALQFWSFKKPLGSGGSYIITAYTGDPAENGGGAGRFGADGKTDLWKLNITNRVIAVDPRDIKLGQKVYIQFPSSSRYVKLQDGTTFDLNGVYRAVDTGGDIKGSRIDLYVGYDNGSGNFWYNMALDIGRVNVKVYKDY